MLTRNTFLFVIFILGCSEVSSGSTPSRDVPPGGSSTAISDFPVHGEISDAAGTFDCSARFRLLVSSSGRDVYLLVSSFLRSGESSSMQLSVSLSASQSAELVQTGSLELPPYADATVEYQSLTGRIDRPIRRLQLRLLPGGEIELAGALARSYGPMPPGAPDVATVTVRGRFTIDCNVPRDAAVGASSPPVADPGLQSPFCQDRLRATGLVSIWAHLRPTKLDASTSDR